MIVRLKVDLIHAELGRLPAGSLADFGEDSARLLIRKGKAEKYEPANSNKDIGKRSDSSGDGIGKQRGRKKPSKG